MRPTAPKSSMKNCPFFDMRIRGFYNQFFSKITHLRKVLTAFIFALPGISMTTLHVAC